MLGDAVTAADDEDALTPTEVTASDALDGVINLFLRELERKWEGALPRQ